MAEIKNELFKVHPIGITIKKKTVI